MQMRDEDDSSENEAHSRDASGLEPEHSVRIMSGLNRQSDHEHSISGHIATQNPPYTHNAS